MSPAIAGIRRPVALGVAALLVAAGAAAGSFGHRLPLVTCVVGGLALAALYVRQSQALSSLSFTLWILAFVTTSMSYPGVFRAWNGFPLSDLIVPLIQIIMFGMGTALSARDFALVFETPWPVVVGFSLQFLIMPLCGWALTHAFGFQGALAAGVILVGAAPGGVASNVITYLARGNLALSVTLTACTTLASPFMTSLAMKVLAGRYVPISASEMMVSILKMVIVPIVAGLIVNRALRGRDAVLRRALPVVSMGGICFVIAIITALSRDKLMQVGLALVAAVVIHNAVGYLLGYWGSRLAGLAEADCRTVAIEVGLQNAGMASGLAISALKSAEAGLAPAVFGPWMNVSGSVLASWWRSRPPASPEGPPLA